MLGILLRLTLHWWLYKGGLSRRLLSNYSSRLSASFWNLRCLVANTRIASLDDKVWLDAPSDRVFKIVRRFGLSALTLLYHGLLAFGFLLSSIGIGNGGKSVFVQASRVIWQSSWSLILVSRFIIG